MSVSPNGSGSGRDNAARPAKASAQAEPSPFERAQAQIGELLDAVGVKYILCIDDEDFTDSTDLIIGLAAEVWALNPTQATRALKKIPGIKQLPEDEDAREALIREKASALDPSSRRSVLHALVDRRKVAHAENKSEPADDAHDLFSSTLPVLLAGYRVERVDPADWKATGHATVDAALRRARDDGPFAGLPDTLVLFDIDLTQAGLSDRGGIVLAQELLASFGDRSVLCGLISSKVPYRDARADWNREQLDLKGANRDRFVLLSKLDLDENPMSFAAEFKHILLAPDVARLRGQVDRILRRSHTAAQAKVEKVDLFDIVHSVIHLTHEEGASELETLRRLSNAFVRTEVRQRARQQAKTLRPLIERIRAISQLAPLARRSPELTAWRLQRREMYDEAVEVNSLFLPLEVGDLFVVADPDTGAEEHYVLLTQPCDTVMRGRAKKRALLLATLARVVSEKPGGDDSRFDLPWFADGKAAYVTLRDTITVPFAVLDMCVYQRSGTAAFTLGSKPPTGLLPGWEARHTEVGLVAAQFIERYAEAFKGLMRRRHKFVTPLDPLEASPLVATISASRKRITFNCQRSGRVVDPYARALLAKAGHYIGRDVFDVDLGKEVKVTRDSAEPQSTTEG